MLNKVSVMSRKALIILLATLSPWLACNAQTVHGRITGNDGLPMPGASVYVPELRQGTTSNQDGFYELSLPSGIYNISYQLLGYTPVTKKITVGKEDIRADVVMEEEFYEIPAVTVSPSDKDPALYIMRKVIGLAPYHLNQVSMYKAEVYIRGGGRIDKLPKIIKRQMKAEADDVQLEEGKYYFSESVNVITFTAPDKYVHQVISSHTNVTTGDDQVSPMDYLEASFYQPVLADLAISPLAPNAFSHYTFKYLGSSLEGEYLIDKISVTPKRKSQQLFEGVIYIVEDLWAIRSLDLTNENMAGKIRIRQVYAPVEETIWMPVSHEFEVDLSIMGIKGRATYTSAVKYLEVEPNRSLPEPSGYLARDEIPVETENKTATQKEIEEILSHDELTSRDMSRLAKLNEKNAEKSKEKAPLEIQDKTTYIIEEEALNRDSAYWEEIRPIPLTEEEKASIGTIAANASVLAKRDTSTLSLTVGAGSQDKEKSPAVNTIKAIATGKRWKLSEDTYLDFDGLLDLKSFSFNTVDGFIVGTGLILTTKTEKGRSISLAPSARYAFSRQKLMWNIAASLMYDPMKSGSIFLRAGSSSDEFSASGVNPLINTVSSLFFRENWMKLYNSTFVTLGHRSDLANGLNLSLSVMYERREPLENTTNFSFLNPDHDYSPNVLDNPFAKGQVEGYDSLFSFSHSQVSFSAELAYTPRQRYRISNGTKINAGSDWPTFTLRWKHGYNYNDTLSGHFDKIMAEVGKTSRYGFLNEFSWRVCGGGFVNRHNVQLQDMYFFNTQQSPVLLNNYTDAFHNKPYYSISSPSYFAEGQIKYTSPVLLLKRLPGLSRTLIRENIGLSALWTPDYGYYYEAGYSLSEIFFMAEVGLYAGFRDLSFDALALRLILRFE